MKKIVCISSMLVLIQLCVGMQDNLTERYSNIAQLDERYSESFLKYCMSHIDCKIEHDEFNQIARGADYVFSYTNDALKKGSGIDQAFMGHVIAYFYSAYKAYERLKSGGETCDNVCSHPHLTYEPEEAFLFRFILKICEKPAF